MLFLFSAVLALAGVSCARSGPTRRASSSGSGTYSVTPHTSYSSSVGVLGCKIDYNRVAYWPMEVDCDSMCIKLTNNGNSLTVLHVDTSGGAYDISYDAWSQLNCGVPGSAQTCVGGGVNMQYEWVDMSQCSDILNGTGKLPFAAANSMNQISSCLSSGDNWTADNYELYNIATPTCTYGYDEKCTLNYPAENNPVCPNQLGAQPALTSDPVYNINFPNTGMAPVSLAT
ncbi:hypothetical protein N0V93_007565 [Gnomoniopsis smithogilvyi]|uniref:Uncharacterized protein n=1 Tax=Gnomoniopsis smithogilvyi TaxID=1191159 RepID=A0A9W8YRT6_9PEZI|nr:hypothetical protein N0V93_007565 [Gnomoniopsis smithogilvyi]